MTDKPTTPAMKLKSIKLRDLFQGYGVAVMNLTEGQNGVHLTPAVGHVVVSHAEFPDKETHIMDACIVQKNWER